MEYTVQRQHYGDRLYLAGETRKAEPRDVAHLIEKGILIKKAAPAVKNKAAPAVKNKAK